MPTGIERSYRSIRLPGDDPGPHLPHGVAQTDTENRLVRVLENIDNLARRSFEIEAIAVGEQVIFGVAIDDLGQTFAEFAVEKTHDLADALQREPLAAEFADHSNFGQAIERVEAAMTFTLRLDHTTLVPPLQLPGRDAGERDDIPRCEAILHDPLNCSETIAVQNVSHILGMRGCGSSKRI